MGLQDRHGIVAILLLLQLRPCTPSVFACVSVKKKSNRWETAVTALMVYNVCVCVCVLHPSLPLAFSLSCSLSNYPLVFSPIHVYLTLSSLLLPGHSQDFEESLSLSLSLSLYLYVSLLSLSLSGLRRWK